MNYSFEKITTVALCNMLLATAQKKMLHLERTRRNLGELIGRFTGRIDAIARELAVVQLLLDAFIPAYHALPDGSKYKIDLNIKIKRLEFRQAKLHKQALRYNMPALLAKQVKYNRLDSRVSAMAHFIAGVQNRRNALHNGALLAHRAKINLAKSRPADNIELQLRAGLLPASTGAISAAGKKQQDIRQEHLAHRPRAAAIGWPTYTRGISQHAAAGYP